MAKRSVSLRTASKRTEPCSIRLSNTECRLGVAATMSSPDMGGRMPEPGCTVLRWSSQEHGVRIERQYLFPHAVRTRYVSSAGLSRLHSPPVFLDH